MDKKIARVFPIKSVYAPIDEHVFFGPPGLLQLNSDYDEVHVSCVFTWDKRRAEILARVWRRVCSNTKLGGPAYDDPGGEFVPGRYVKHGIVITSRGCCRKCDFCFVPKREGRIRELVVKEGNIIADNNLLACSRGHIEKVFKMLQTQKQVRFTGGLDVRLMRDWHIEKLVGLGPKLNYFFIAYDSPKMKDVVEDVIDRCYKAGLSRSHIACYVLMGFLGDTIEEADKRCEWVFVQGGKPFAMLYRGPDDKGYIKPEWMRLKRMWTDRFSMFSRIRKEGLKYHKKIVRGKESGYDGVAQTLKSVESKPAMFFDMQERSQGDSNT
jgi:hypothetical protein